MIYLNHQKRVGRAFLQIHLFKLHYLFKNQLDKLRLDKYNVRWEVKDETRHTLCKFAFVHIDALYQQIYKHQMPEIYAFLGMK